MSALPEFHVFLPDSMVSLCERARRNHEGWCPLPYSCEDCHNAVLRLIAAGEGGSVSKFGGQYLRTMLKEAETTLQRAEPSTKVARGEDKEGNTIVDIWEDFGGFRTSHTSRCHEAVMAANHLRIEWLGIIGRNADALDNEGDKFLDRAWVEQELSDIIKCDISKRKYREKQPFMDMALAKLGAKDRNRLLLLTGLEQELHRAIQNAKKQR